MTSLFLQISCHVGMRKQAYIFLFFTAACQIQLLQIPQDFLWTSNTTSCPFFPLSLRSGLFHKTLKYSDEVTRKAQDIHLAHPVPFYF